MVATAGEGIAPGDIVDITTTLPKGLKSILVHHGLALKFVLNKHQASLEHVPNCEEPVCVELEEDLRAEHQINLRLMRRN